jgi:hypothetical protein
MKALLLNTKSSKVEEIEVGDFKDIQKALNCRAFTSAGYLPNGDIAFCDDEGLLTDPQSFVYCPAISPTPFAGNVLIIGTGECGESKDAETKDVEVKFLSKLEILLMIFA